MTIRIVEHQPILTNTGNNSQLVQHDVEYWEEGKLSKLLATLTQITVCKSSTFLQNGINVVENPVHFHSVLCLERDGTSLSGVSHRMATKIVSRERSFLGRFINRLLVRFSGQR